MARRFLHGAWIEFAHLNPFKPEWITSWDERPRLEDLYIAIGVDPAISKKDTASRTAMVVVGQPLRGLHRTEIYVLKAIAGHWSAYESTDRLLALVKEFQPRALRIEDVAWQRALREIVEKEARTRGVLLPALDLVKPDRDKLRRANQVSPLVESGRVLFGGPGANELIEALLAVPHDKGAWDLTDAFGLAVRDLPALAPEQTAIRPPGAPGAKRARSYATKVGARDSGLPVVTHRGPSPYWEAPNGATWGRPPGSLPGGSDRRKIAASYAIKMGR
jgi:predicted phage terminase large subunit-like protein